jgi:hypothetical protein
MVERGKGKEDLPRMHHERERIGGGRLTCEARIPLRCSRSGQSNATNMEERERQGELTDQERTTILSRNGDFFPIVKKSISIDVLGVSFFLSSGPRF